MAEIWFYHLERQPLKQVLPQLLSRGLQQGRRMVVQTATVETIPQISDLLWAAEDVAFLAHGFGDDAGTQQLLWLCADDANPNSASYRFYVEGALPTHLDGLERALILFESSSEDELATIRNEWKKRKAEGHSISYWKQDESGKWQNLA